MAPPRVQTRKETVGCVLAATCLALSLASVAVGEDGWRWRVNKVDDGRLLLSFSEFEAGDAMSARSFYCKPSSGRIDVHGSTDKKQREVLADLIRSNSNPTVQLENEAASLEMAHSDVDGWVFHFGISADGPAFEKFKRTGQMGFKIGSLVVNDKKATAGFDKVSEFQAACRKRPGEPKVQR